MGELQTKQEFVVPPAEYPPTATARLPAYKTMIKSQEQVNTLTRLEKKRIRLKADIIAQAADPAAQELLEESLLEVQNTIAQTRYEQRQL